MKALLVAVLSVATLCSAGDTETFGHVKIHRHRSPQARVLVDKVGTVTFDDASRKFAFRKTLEDRLDTPENVEMGYDSVTKVVFEATAHMRGGAAAQVLTATGLLGAIVGSQIAGQHVQDYWFYLEYTSSDQTERVLLEVPKDSSLAVIAKAQSVFGNRVEISLFPEVSEEIDPGKLPDFKSKEILKINKHDHPLPESKEDKATIVVVCPPLAARDTGRGNQFKLHANDHVIAVNRAGTYSFAYIDPGKYRLVSQSENASGFEMEVEAGKTYYFLQNTFQGLLRWRTTLSQDSPELVTYLMDGAYHAEWSRK